MTIDLRFIPFVFGASYNQTVATTFNLKVTFGQGNWWLIKLTIDYLVLCNGAIVQYLPVLDMIVCYQPKFDVCMWGYVSLLGWFMEWFYSWILLANSLSCTMWSNITGRVCSIRSEDMGCKHFDFVFHMGFFCVCDQKKRADLYKVIIAQFCV